MIVTYLFEMKSIQSYLFSSGKLKDVIAASERLDRLIDSSQHSILYHVTKELDLNTDLLGNNIIPTSDTIHFLRCRGGAFYAYSQSKSPLLKLRNLWTLTVQQLFPSLEFTDALNSAESLSQSMEHSHKDLASSRNSPQIKFPMATAPSVRYQRTGMSAVPPTSLAVKASINKEFDNDDFDLDVEHHRQAYQAFNMRTNAGLQDRFTPEDLKGKVNYPINLEKDFEFSAKALGDNADIIQDIALIHIDGNGLGILLRALKNELNDKDSEKFCKGFRMFSDALNQATEQAAKKATQWVYDNTLDKVDDKVYLPMRPIVLGGDDVTLFCRADLALDYSVIFCKAFKEESEKALKPLFSEMIPTTQMKNYLTASGGILFAKASHPFANSHHLVEGLCSHAKQLTKGVDENGQHVGPAALAFYRLSNTVSTEFEDVYQQSQCYYLSNDTRITLGYSAYFVEDELSYRKLSTLKSLADFCEESNTPVSISKWRQMATQLAADDLSEAERIYNRAISLCSDKKKVEYLESLLSRITKNNEDCEHKWYWKEESQPDLKTIINDLLIVDHFSVNRKEGQ